MKTAYFLDPDVGSHHFGPRHPMKPHRMALTNALVISYDLHAEMDVINPYRASAQDMIKFHDPEYIKYLQTVTPQKPEMGSKFCHTDDCPIWDGLFEFCQSYAGASLEGAARLNHNLSEICINWAGGLHHAKKSDAAGFCYVNDIVLAILELLKYHPRVVYIDIDVHHGDGVQEAFYATDRVMTVSFHGYGKHFFPGSGDVFQTGVKKGKLHSVNVPLKENITADTYVMIFKKVMTMVMESYKPTAVVLQCGADSLGGDKLGKFALSIKGHGECVKFIESFKLPLLVLGGGGYTVKNVARCWTFETSLLVNKEIANELPINEYYGFYGPDFSLFPDLGKGDDLQNDRAYLDNILQPISRNLRDLQGAPSVQMNIMPSDLIDSDVLYNKN